MAANGVAKMNGVRPTTTNTRSAPEEIVHEFRAAIRMRAGPSNGVAYKLLLAALTHADGVLVACARSHGLLPAQLESARQFAKDRSPDFTHTQWAELIGHIAKDAPQITENIPEPIYDALKEVIVPSLLPSQQSTERTHLVGMLLILAQPHSMHDSLKLWSDVYGRLTSASCNAIDAFRKGIVLDVYSDDTGD